MLDEAPADAGVGRQPLTLHGPQQQTAYPPSRSGVELGPPRIQQPVLREQATSGISLLLERPTRQHSSRVDAQFQHPQQQHQQATGADRTARQAAFGPGGLHGTQASANPPEQSAQGMLRASSPAASALAQRPHGDLGPALQAPRPAVPLFSNAGLPPPVQLPTSLLTTRPSTPAGSYSQVGNCTGQRGRSFIIIAVVQQLQSVDAC